MALVCHRNKRYTVLVSLAKKPTFEKLKQAPKTLITVSSHLPFRGPTDYLSPPRLLLSFFFFFFFFHPSQNHLKILKLPYF